jgi:hypothetical protein
VAGDRRCPQPRPRHTCRATVPDRERYNCASWTPSQSSIARSALRASPSSSEAWAHSPHIVFEQV